MPAELRRQVGDRIAVPVRVRAVEPGVLDAVHVTLELVHEGVVLAHERLAAQEGLPDVRLDRLDDLDRIVGALPVDGIDVPEQEVRAR